MNHNGVRIVHVVPALFRCGDGVIGGAERYALALAKSMAGEIPTTLVSFGEKDASETLKRFRKAWQWRFLASVAKLLRNPWRFLTFWRVHEGDSVILKNGNAGRSLIRVFPPARFLHGRTSARTSFVF